MSQWLCSKCWSDNDYGARCSCGQPGPPTRLHAPGALADVLGRALKQATEEDGKGMERHGSPGVPFEDQPIVGIGKLLGSADFQIGQAIKKGVESKRLPKERAVAELLGAINYLAAAVILREGE